MFCITQLLLENLKKRARRQHSTFGQFPPLLLSHLIQHYYVDTKVQKVAFFLGIYINGSTKVQKSSIFLGILLRQYYGPKKQHFSWDFTSVLLRSKSSTFLGILLRLYGLYYGPKSSIFLGMGFYYGGSTKVQKVAFFLGFYFGSTTVQKVAFSWDSFLEVLRYKKWHFSWDTISVFLRSKKQHFSWESTFVVSRSKKQHFSWHISPNHKVVCPYT